MRIDRSRIRIVRRIDNGGTWNLIEGCVVAYGALEIEVWPEDPIDRPWIVEAWMDGRIAVGSAEEREVLDMIEACILEAAAGLSAHQRIAMIRDGLLIPELPHPGDA